MCHKYKVFIKISSRFFLKSLNRFFLFEKKKYFICAKLHLIKLREFPLNPKKAVANLTPTPCGISKNESSKDAVKHCFFHQFSSIFWIF